MSPARRHRPTPGLALPALLLACGLAAAPASGERAGSAPVVGPETGRALRHGVSRPLREIGFHQRAYPPGFEVEVPLGRVARQRPPDLPGGEDPLRQLVARPDPGAALTPAPTINFDGISNIDGVLPPDTNGDVGPDHYVQWVNLSFAIFDKTTGAIVPGGGPFSGESLWSGFGGPCENNNNGDPIVLYDHLAGRWLLSQFSINEGIQCVALSQTGDPLGSYDRWEFTVSPGQRNDYPKLGVMPDAYYLTVRDFPFDQNNFAGFVAFDRAAMLAGDPNAGFVKFGLPCDTTNNDCPDYVQPPHLEGPAPAAGTPGFFTKVWDDDFEGPWSGAGGADGYRIWKMVPDFSSLPDPGSSTFTELPFVPASADFSTNMCGGARACIPEPAPPGSLCARFGIDCPTVDAIADGQMYRAQYRSFAGHNTLVLNNTVDATGSDVAGIRWVELRNPDPAGAGAWSLFQDGTYAPADGDNRWMGSAAMDQSGNIALGYSVSSLTTFPSIRYTSRESGDAAGTMPGGEVELVAGAGSQTSSSNRWGDYSSMSVDPVDDCTFWYTQEYYSATSSSGWRTRIGAFKLDACGAASIVATPNPHAFAATEVGATSAPVTLTITNDGASDYDVTALTLSNTTDFALDPSPVSDPCGMPPFTLAAGADCNVEVAFAPQSQAVFSETLTVATDAAGVEEVIALSGTGFVPCSDPLDHQTLTGTAGGAISVSTCLTVTLQAYTFTGGDLDIVTGQAITVENGSSLANEAALALDPFKALP